MKFTIVFDKIIEQQKPQMYERAKLRYYYAIVECSDIPSAVHLYHECDELEFERTANKCVAWCLALSRVVDLQHKA